MFQQLNRKESKNIYVTDKRRKFSVPNEQENRRGKKLHADNMPL